MLSISRACEEGDVGTLGCRVRRWGALITLLCPLAAQQFARLGQQMPTTSFKVTAQADFDGNGTIDLYGSDRVWLNQGAARFVEGPAIGPFGGAGYEGPAAAGDVDADGDVDVIVRAGGLWLMENSGQAIFTPRAINSLLQSYSNVELADVDADGDLDIVTASNGLVVFRNDGVGGFGSQITYGLFGNVGCRLADVDGDGDLDGLVIAAFYQAGSPPPIHLYINDGTGSFTWAWFAVPLGVGRPGIRNLALGDIDGDGDVDMVSSGDYPDVYLGNGAGSFQQLLVALPGPSGVNGLTVDLADLDGDSDLDLVFGGRDVEVLWNSGTGQFTLAPTLRSGWTATGIFVADYDGDGDSDIVSSGELTKLYLNDGAGRFANVTSQPLPEIVRGNSYFVDADGDQDLDVFTDFSSSLDFIINRGNLDYVLATPPQWPVTYRGGAALIEPLFGDFDGDGDCDVAYSGLLCLGDGRGNFVSATGRMPSLVSAPTSEAVCGDLDGDGDLDIVVCPQSNADRSRVWLNQGPGVFVDVSSTHMPAVGVSPWPGCTAASLADTDLDGDLDLVTASARDQVRLFTNNGAGVFTESTTTTLPAISGVYDLKMSDLDGDADVDIVVAMGYPAGLELLINNAGAFTRAATGQLPALVGGFKCLALGDVDADGDCDILTGTSGLYFPGGPSIRGRLFRLSNNGLGAFTQTFDATLDSTLFELSWLAIADIETDGDPDLLVHGGLYNPPRLYTNLSSHHDTPLAPVISRPFEIDVHADPARFPAPIVAQPFFALQKAWRPLPGFIGFAGIDPDGAVPLSPFTLSASGSGSISVTVPFVPALVGLPVNSQSILVGSSLWLTNARQDVILR